MRTYDDKGMIADYIGGLSSIKVAKKHSVSKGKVLKVLRLNGITRRNIKYYRKFKVNEDYFSEINTHEKAYWLGFIFADGNVCGNRFTLAQKEPDILRDFAKSIGVSEEIIYEYKGGIKMGAMYRVNISSNKLCADLIKHGIHPNKTHRNDGIPKIKYGFLSSFIRGFFDGDGSISCNMSNPKNARNVEFSIINCSKKMIMEVQAILMRECNLNKTKLKSRTFKDRHNQRKNYVLVYSGNRQCKRIFDFIYENASPRLERKYQKFIEFFNRPKLINSYMAA
jgi:intein/homing endonuclease